MSLWSFLNIWRANLKFRDRGCFDAIKSIRVLKKRRVAAPSDVVDDLAGDALDFPIDCRVGRDQRRKLRVEAGIAGVEPTYLHSATSAAVVAASIRAISGINSSRRTFSAD